MRRQGLACRRLRPDHAGRGAERTGLTGGHSASPGPNPGAWKCVGGCGTIGGSKRDGQGVAKGVGRSGCGSGSGRSQSHVGVGGDWSPQARNLTCGGGTCPPRPTSYSV